MTACINEMLEYPDKIEFSSGVMNGILYINHSFRYESAYLGNHLIKNQLGIYLSRIPKKNGKHRYYLTKQEVDPYCPDCGDYVGDYKCRSYECSGCVDECVYKSRYVGKDIKKALLELSLNIDQPVFWG